MIGFAVGMALIPLIHSTLMPESIHFGPGTPQSVLQTRQVPHVGFGKTLFYLGYQQSPTSHQDPILMRFDGEQRTWTRNDYDHSGRDMRGYGLFWDGQERMYIAFRLRGAPLEGHWLATLRPGWLPSLTTHTVADVTVLARIDPADGTILASTYLAGRGMDGAWQPWLLTGWGLTPSGNLWLQGITPAARKTNHQPLPCGGVGPYIHHLVLRADLRQALESQCLPNINSGKDWLG